MYYFGVDVRASCLGGFGMVLDEELPVEILAFGEGLDSFKKWLRREDSSKRRKNFDGNGAKRS